MLCLCGAVTSERRTGTVTATAQVLTAIDVGRICPRSIRGAGCTRRSIDCSSVPILATTLCGAGTGRHSCLSACQPLIQKAGNTCCKTLMRHTGFRATTRGTCATGGIQHVSASPHHSLQKVEPASLVELPGQVVQAEPSQYLSGPQPATCTRGRQNRAGRGQVISCSKVT